MFHPEVVKKKCEEASKKAGFKVWPQKLENSIGAYEFFQSITKSDGKKVYYQRGDEDPEKFEFTENEKKWISNELWMCRCGFRYWFYRYFFIKTKDGKIQRPEKLIAQTILLDILAELDLAGVPILLLILKARQLGISTVIEAIILWIALFNSGSHTVIASAEEEKSEQMSEMVWVGLEMLPLWMQPTLTRDDRKLGPEFGLIHSDILIQHGSMSKGISRGSTPIAGHLSEVAYYPDPIETIESSLIRAMHENPRTFLALESTARRKNDWWHKIWLKNRRGEATGYNRFVCLFLPWYVGSDKYPTADWLKNHPIPKDWKPLEETRKQAADARLYVATTPLLKKHMPENWEMPVEQQWFWEFNFVEASDDDAELKSFLAELASDERSAFQSKKFSVFAQDVLDRLEEDKSPKFQDYAILGDGIDKRFALEEFQSHSQRRIDVPWVTMDGRNLNWKLVPLRETPRDETLRFYLRVWEKPKPGYNYTVGIDIASGSGQNSTVYDVLRVGRTIDEPDVQVAQLKSPWIASPESPAFANMLGVWYGQYMSPVPEALMAPEVQIAVGDFISHQLSKLGYTNFYYMKRFDQRLHPNVKPSRRGWATVGWSRQMMMEAYEHAIKHGWVQVNSEDTIAELGWIEEDETDSGKVKYDHEKDKTDDCYMAGGIAYFCSHTEETIMERMAGAVKPKKVEAVKEVSDERESSEGYLNRLFQLEDKRESGYDDDGGEGTAYGY